MPRQVELSIGPPYAGLNTYADPRALSRDHLQTASGADLSRGIVSGYWLPRSTNEVGTGLPVSANARFIHYAAGSGWLSDTVLLTDGRSNWACRDAPAGVNAVSYVTQIQGDGTVNNPKYYAGVQTFQLGVPAPSGGTLAAGTGAARAYSYTLYDTSTGTESNPFAIPGSGGATGAVLSGLQGSAPGTIANKVNIYGTPAGTAAGVQYFLAQINLGTTSWTDSGAAPPGGATQPLNWGPGGFYTNSALPADHSPAPALTCISDGIHGVGAAGTTGQGIVFGAAGSTVYWSMLGYPHHWPTLNQAKLPFPVLAMATRGAITYAFTEGGVWTFSGVSDIAIQVQRAPVTLGVLRFAGKSVAQTPMGIIYLTREGPALLDGLGMLHLLTQGIIDQSAWDAPGLTFYAGAYYDGWYYLQIAGGGCYALDLRRYPTVSLCTVTVSASVFTVIPYIQTAGAITPSLYVADAASGQVHQWRPMEGLYVSGASQAPWTIITPATDWDAPGKIKRLKQIRAAVTGAVTLDVTTVMPDGTQKTATVDLVASQRTYRVPSGFDGVHTYVQATAAAGATQMVNLSLIGDVFDDA